MSSEHRKALASGLWWLVAWYSVWCVILLFDPYMPAAGPAILWIMAAASYVGARELERRST